MFKCTKEGKIYKAIAYVYAPKIGSTINTENALRLCRFFELGYLRERLLTKRYKPWVFDGCSCLPDELIGKITTQWMCVVNCCCLPHDLGYAYGQLGNYKERLRVDSKFYRDLLGMDINGFLKKENLAKKLFMAVRKGGAEKYNQSFSWGFASIKK